MSTKPHRLWLRSLGLALPLLVATAVSGWAAPPDINVRYQSTTILDGDTTPSVAEGTDFGSAAVGGTMDRTFTVENTRNNSTLNLTGNPRVQLSGSTAFTVLAQPATSTLINVSSTTFTIRFSPSASGTFTATVTIPNDDADENPYDFTITGAGSGSPEINVYYQTTPTGDIADGDTTPSLTEGTDFGSVNIGGQLQHTFTITNTGNANLTLTGSPSLVSITGTHASDFTVVQNPATPVAAGGSTSFIVRFGPLAGGTRTATVSIPNNDSNENPYDFSIQGTGAIAAPTVTSPSVANVQDVTATLGGNIASTGGANATERGIYWSATSGFSPPAEGTKVSQTGSYGTGPFSVSVTNLNAGSLLYFRAFATNSQGTGLSAEQAFQTEPSLQPTNLVFSSVTGNSMTISWTPRSGDGVIVVVREGGLPGAGPSDFTTYTAANDPWNGGSDLGGGNYVIYQGSGSAVTISGLSGVTTYGVAVYAYAGSGATDPNGINYQQDGPLTGTQETPGSPPTLSAPSITGFATTNSAILGATIDSDGGSAITQHGTVWDTVPGPTTNALAEGSAVGPLPWSYSHTRSGLPSGKGIYFAGYAVNVNGASYSPDGLIYTEPGTPASNVQFTNVVYNSMTVSWTSSNRDDPYDGSLVLMREVDPVDADPLDGTNYVANTVFGSGAEVGTNNFVVYSGTGTWVTVTGLRHNRAYQVAVYEYSGVSSEINYRLGPATGAQILPVAPSHREAYNIQCSECHAHSGWGTFVARGEDQELMCKSCHVAGGQASAKADVANHVVAGVTTDCGSCHEVHHADSASNPQNILFTDDWRDGAGNPAMNLNWVRGNIAKYFTGQKYTNVVAATPIIWHAGGSNELAGVDRPPGNPIGNQLNSSNKLDRLCQACHTNPNGTTKYHTNDPNDNNIKPTDAAGYTHPANVAGGFLGQDCRDCHLHSKGFAPQVTEVNCLAAGCHSEPQGSRRQIVEATPGDGGGDFSLFMTSHHVNDGLNASGLPVAGSGGGGRQIVTRWDCIVCHAEGDAVTGEITGYHINGSVDLNNVDNAVTALTDANGVYVGWTNISAAARSEFCLSCHDTDGATSITARTDADPDATTNNLNPFNDGVTNAHEPNGFNGSAAPHSRGQVIDVATQFNPNNTSHHAVLGQAYTAATIATWANPGVRNAIKGTTNDGAGGAGRQDLDWTSTLNCEDCHFGSATTKLNGHGTVNSRYMLRNANGADAIGIYSPPVATLICYRCHDPQVNATNYDKHIGRDGDHMDDTRNIYGISCLNCHGGGYIGGQQSWGATHGVDDRKVTIPHNPNVFTYGSGLGNITTWANLGSPSCGAIGSVSVLNNCTQHSAKGSTGQSYTRVHSRTYRVP